MNDKLLIVGGYRQVGRIISTMLGEKFPGRVIAAGRNYHEAKAFSAATAGKVLPMALDIHGSDNVELLQGVKIVVMCVERPDAEFVENCLRRGVHYVDISASYEQNCSTRLRILLVYFTLSNCSSQLISSQKWNPTG